ncbi:MAG: hypothetical protein IKW33_01550 [Clostridia bacterium]|nr:hypothetical protein [Clostridia bacterium]
MENVERVKTPIYRIVIAIIFLACTIFLAYIIGASAVEATSGEQFSGLALLVPLVYAIYGSPVIVFAVVFEIIMLVKKGFSITTISSILLLVAWVGCFVLPYIVQG